MNNKGFTLVELLAVIVITTILLGVAVPNVIGVSQRVRKNMFCSKVDNIESAAKLYASDNEDIVESSNNELIIYVSTLVENNYFKKEKDTCILKSSDNPCITDPRDNSSLDNDKITITKSGKRFNVIYDEDKRSVCN